MRRLARLAVGLLLLAASPEAPTRAVLDAFDGIAGWIAAPSEAAARKAFPRRLPGN